MASETGIVVANLRLLEQGYALIDRISDGAFAHEAASAKPVGPHFRHVLEHYSSFLDGLASGRIDYDARAREAAIETERPAACGRIRELIGGLTMVDSRDLEQECQARLECGLGDDADQWSRTTVRRELHFLMSHTIHHYALIGLLLAQRGIDPGADWGVAPSTLKYWRSQASCAPHPG
jgi:uncharacterized damage-inducible protein DinB